MTYLDRPEQWERLNKYLMAQPEVGLDTEFLDGEDAVSNKVTVWSVAGFKPGARQHPRGYSVAAGYCLPAEALPFFRGLFTSSATIKWVHNAPADTRSIYDTTGIVLERARCTLQYARVALPWLTGYGLKELSVTCLGRPPRESFVGVTTYMEKTVKVKNTRENWCTCGVPKCKKRKPSMLGGQLVTHGHHTTRRFLATVTQKEAKYSIDEFKPGHPRWDRWVAYSIADAVDGLELASYLHNFASRSPGHPFGPEAQHLARRFVNADT